MMKRLFISEEKDFWYCLTENRCFQLSLLMKARPADNVSLEGFCLDGKGNPHLFIVSEQRLKCCYWNGLAWKTKAVPLIIDPVSIYPVFREGIEQHFLVSTDGNSSYQHYCLTDSGWVTEDLFFVENNAAIIAFMPRNRELALVYLTKSSAGNRLSVVCFDGRWNDKQQISLGPLEFCTIAQGCAELLLLFAKEEADGSRVKIVRMPYKGPAVMEEYCCAFPGNMYKPVLARVNNAYKVCWTEGGKICLASLEPVSYRLGGLLESKIFFPAEIIPLSGKGTEYLAFSAVYGTKLEFPLILKAEAFEKMMKAHDHTGLNYRLFSRVGHNGSPVRRFYK